MILLYPLLPHFIGFLNFCASTKLQTQYLSYSDLQFLFLIFRSMPLWEILCCKEQETPKQQRKSRKSKKQVNVNEPQKVKNSQKRITRKIISVFQKQEKFEEKKDIYDGEQLNGIPHGTGIKNYANGDYYRGEWVNGLKQGRGLQSYFEVQTKYQGEWKQDFKNGNGKYTEENGSYFEGQFKDGVKHGKGQFFDTQKQILYMEQYDNGKLIERKQLKRERPKQAEEFPTLVLDKQRFNSQDLVRFQDTNPQIKELDLDFLLKYYGLCKTIHLQFIDVNISEWNIKQVLAFLEEIDLKSYQQIFYQNRIKGKDLLSLEESQMKVDLKMKLGDRKRLINYIQYISCLHKPKKSVQKKNLKNIKKRVSIGARTLTMRKGLQSEGNMNVIMEKSDEQWHESQSPDYPKDRKEKTRNFVTQDWEKFHSGAIQLYHSQAKARQKQQPDRISHITEKGSNDIEREDFETPGYKRKRSEERKQEQNGPKEHLSSESVDSDSSLEELKNLKRKKTGGVNRSTQMEDLYRFLKEHQNLDFLIKQKDIEIIEQIGEGSYGQVYRGKYISCPIAVKDYMKTGRLHKSKEDFMKEVEVLSDLKHPNIVLYMGLCIKFNHYQLVTQFMENGSLYDQIHKKKKKFCKEEQLQIIDDIVRGMVYLHSMKNMLHRDLKSSNVLIDQDWKVKLCDFGLSGHKKKTKKKNNRIGTYQWMAPQVIRNQQIDFPSDVYSFGVIIWELLSQKIPYQGLLQAQIIGLVGYDEGHTLPSPEGSDEFMFDIMKKCLQRNTKERPSFIQIQQYIEKHREKKSNNKIDLSSHQN